MITLLPVTGLPEIREGDDLAALVAQRTELRDGDVVVVAQKVVSKAEGAYAEPEPGEPPAQARRRLAHALARRVLADTERALVVETAHGLVCANAGIDASNVPGGRLTLLPDDPDASARRLRDRLRALTGAEVAVVVSDTFGRPWRLGQTDVAIGVAGVEAIRDERGGLDRHGKLLEVTEVAVADELAAAADLARTKAGGVPVVIVRGAGLRASPTASARDLVRPPQEDLFPRGRGGLGPVLADLAAPEPAWSAGVDAIDLVVLDLVAGAADTAPPVPAPPEPPEPGAPTRFDVTVCGGLAAGLLAALLADRGYVVRLTGDGRFVVAGRPAAAEG